MNWDLKNKQGAVVPDGTYTIRMELADRNTTSPAQNRQGSFTFVKGAAPQSQTGLMNAGFTGVSITFTPGAGTGGGSATGGGTASAGGTAGTAGGTASAGGTAATAGGTAGTGGGASGTGSLGGGTSGTAGGTAGGGVDMTKVGCQSAGASLAPLFALARLLVVSRRRLSR